MSEPSLNWDDYLQVASLSDVGMRRATNQDNFSVSLANSMNQFQRKGHLFIVADGMGAHAAGELASKLAIDHIPHLYTKILDSNHNYASVPESLRQSIQEANGEIWRRGQANEEFHNMGTTCSTLLLLPQGAVVAHIGDSRVYRLSQNRLDQLTFDHSLVWEMKAAGQLSDEEEKAGKVPRNVITRSLGPYQECKVDLEGPFPLQVGDAFLLCSDGLTGVISDVEIGAVLANMEPVEAVRVLVDLANLRGGPDNITVVVIKVKHPQLGVVDQSTPLNLQPRKKKISISPIAWAVFGGAAFFALLFYIQSGWQTAILPGAVALIALLYVCVQWIRSLGTVNQGGNRLGKAPYTRIGVSSGAQFARQLAETVAELKQGAVEQNWGVDWDRWNSLLQKAESDLESNRYAASIGNYGRAISFLMEQLRTQQDGSASSIDL